MRLLNVSVMWVFFVLFSGAVQAAQTSTVYTEKNLAISVSADHPEFVIKLKSNPSTGYSWFLRTYDHNLLKPIKHTFEAPVYKGKVGVPGFDVWIFRVLPAGFIVPQQTQLRFVYVRPWEAESTSAQQLVFSVATQQR